MKGSKNEEGPAIGIDLGTTNSCVGVFQNDRVYIIHNGHGYRTTPSYVSFKGNQRLVGDAAKNLVATNPSNTIFDAKRLIGRRFSDPTVQADMKLWPFRVIQGRLSDTPKIVVSYKGKELQLSAEEISSMILVKMKETAEYDLNKPVKKAVITVPAYFNDSQRKATKDAGAIAGLEVIRIINEPTAAAIAYGLDKKSEISGTTNVLVFDLGGGTFDVSLMTIEEGNTFEVQAVAGDTHLGGEDFNNRMVSDCVKEFKKKFNKDLTGNQKALGRLRVSCEKAKKELSYVVETSIELDGLLGEDFSMTFHRAKFDKLNVASFNKCIETVKQCLSDANMEKSSVNEVILVGGSTRIPMIQKMLREFFDGRDLSVSVNPDEAVACGAAILAAKLSGSSDKTVQDLVLADVTPLSLGVAVRRDVFDVVIPRNTRIPTKKSKIYLTTEDNQLETCIEVYQGERMKSKDNHLLGKFLFSDIPPAPRGKIQFEDSFEIDADGILTVTSKILSTGKTKKITITSQNGRLSKEEIEKMIKDAEMYKHEDQEFKNRADAHNALQDRLDEIHDNKIKKRVHTRSLKKIENAVANTTEWLHDSDDASVNDFKSKQARLESLCKPLILV